MCNVSKYGNKMKKNLKTLALGVLAASVLSGCNQSFSDSQKKEIEVIASEYFVAHPEILVAAGQELQKRQMAAQEQVVKKVAAQYANKLTQDPQTPFVGDADSAVSVVEFFDYQCLFCSKISSDMAKLQDENKDVKFVYKETPIFASQWQASGYAADMGNWVFKLKGSDAYSNYHEAIFKTGKDEGRLQVSDINAIAEQTGLTKSEMAKMPKASYSDTFGLFGALGFGGTPAVIVMPTNGATAENIHVINGYNPAGIKAALASLKSELSAKVSAEGKTDSDKKVEASQNAPAK